VGRRSRKRRPGTAAPRAARPAARTPRAAAAPPPPQPEPQPQPRPAPRVSRGEARNAEVRARLQPYAADERPPALRIAAGLAVVIGLGNLVAFLAGAEVSGEQPDLISVVFLAVLFLAAAYGMWQKRYWAVIGFQVILGFTITFAALALLGAQNVWGAALCVGLMAGGGWLFWKLVRVMSRIQVPRPGGRQGTGLR
jgi:hypothetical protein